MQAQLVIFHLVVIKFKRALESLTKIAVTGFRVDFTHLLPLFNGWSLNFLDGRRLFYIVGVFGNLLTLVGHEVRSAFSLVFFIVSLVFPLDVPFEGSFLAFYFQAEPTLHSFLTSSVFLARRNLGWLRQIVQVA